MQKEGNSTLHGEKELLTLRVSEQEYAMDIMSVREIRGWTKVTPLPHAPRFIRGVINLRGTILPIIDLAARLGEPCGSENSRNVVIVIQDTGQTFGILVEDVSNIISIPQVEMQSPPKLAAESSSPFIQALTIYQGRLIRVLNLTLVTSYHKETPTCT